jgi:competence protein ComEC
MVLYPVLCFPGDLTVVFLDAGEGDAIYVEAPGGERALVDAGNLISGYSVADSLIERGADALDALIITHPHPDHMGGVFHLLQRLRVNSRYDNGQKFGNRPEEDIYRWYSDIFRSGNYRALRAGDRVALGKVVIDVLSPGQLGPGRNRNSLVLRLAYGETAFLLMGDAGASIERTLLEKGVPIDADILKVGHHGASDASTETFLDAVTPGYAVISVDENNVRGHPDEDVLQRLRERDIAILITYREGDIAFSSDGRKVRRLR